ncbi:MAG: DNA-deoxyinosine glycosylase [Planctomycetota bacterium]|jgi:hypoxanthine-DNA glycosylase|nr:DNA-deoxyinosine glycosylase [Planctomycetota bacterium]
MAVPAKPVAHPFPPLYDADSVKLILGTMPSPQSRARQFYYGHPQNRFWRVIAAVYREPPPRAPAEKRSLLSRHRLALWDVLARCEISGAADATIVAPVANDLTGLLRRAPITRVYANGTRAYQLYQKLCYPQTGIAATPLPSTSPANARFSLAKLIAAYAAALTPESAARWN